MTYQHNDVISMLKTKSFGSIKLLGSYTKMRNIHQFLCNKCQHKWKTSADAVVNGGKGCPNCKGGTGLNKKSENYYKKEIKLLSREQVVLIDRYVDNKTKIKHKCLKCSNEYLCIPLRITCLKCKHKDYTLSQSVYEDRVSYAHNDKIEVLEVYKNSHTKIKHFCKECSHTWRPYPTHVLKGHGCPKCNQGFCLHKESILHDRVVTVKGFEPQALDYLISRGIKAENIVVFSEGTVPTVKFNKNRKHYPDIFVPSTNTLYEVKGCATLGMIKGTQFNSVKSGEELYYELVAKCEAAIDMGYKYEVLLCKNKKLIKLPKNWQLLSYLKFRELWLKW